MSPATTPLCKIAEVTAGGGAPQDSDAFTSEGTPFVRAGSLKPLVNGALESNLEHLTDEVAKEHGLRKFPRDTIVFAKSGMSATKGHVYRLRGEAYVVNHLAALIPNRRVVPEFLEHSLRVFSPIRLIQDASYPSIRLGAVATMQIPLPPLGEQRRIAKVLGRAEALRFKRRAALAQVDSLTQSLFLDLFGDPTTNPKGWRSLRLHEALSIPLRNGLSPSKTGKVSAKVLTLSAITGSGFDSTALKTSTFRSAPPADQSVDDADFLICRGNGNVHFVGKGYFPTCRMPDVTFPDTMIAARVSPERIERSFLQHIWNSNAVRRQVEALARTTNGTFKVNQTMLEGITFWAPQLSLQREFARRVQAVEKLKGTQFASLAELDALFAALQYRAFRGEL